MDVNIVWCVRGMRSNVRTVCMLYIVYAIGMYTIIDQKWKKKDNICMLFALYAAMSEKQKFIVTVSESLDC